MRQTIGDPEFTSGYYKFEESPNCGYNQKIRVTGLPAFVIHNRESSSFTVPMVTDLSQVGVYTVTVKSAITIPTNITPDASQFETLQDEFTFKIYIEACMVNSFFADPVAADIEYELGRPALANVSPYAFSQTPDCGYPIKLIEVNNLPTFVTHNAATQDFSVPFGSDLSLIGEHYFDILSDLSVPADSLLINGFMTITTQYRVRVII